MKTTPTTGFESHPSTEPSEREPSAYQKPYAGNWSVFNSGGASICEGVNFEIAADYMTTDRFARGWTMVECRVIKTPEDLAALAPSVAAPQTDYPLPDSLYSGSKDWIAGNYAARVEWLHTMYESKKVELEQMLELAVSGEDAARPGLLKLARYGAAMLHWHRGDNPGESGDVDAITCEEEAQRCGVLEGRNVDGPCCDQCVCAPFVGWEVCYFVPDDVRAEIDRFDAARDGGATAGEAPNVR